MSRRPVKIALVAAAAALAGSAVLAQGAGAAPQVSAAGCSHTTIAIVSNIVVCLG